MISSLLVKMWQEQVLSGGGSNGIVLAVAFAVAGAVIALAMGGDDGDLDYWTSSRMLLLMICLAYLKFPNIRR